MIVTLDRRGGFAGFDQRLGAVDLHALPPDVESQAQTQLQELLRLAADFPPAVGADFLRFEMRLEEDGIASAPLQVPDEGDWNQPLPRAFARFAKTIGIPI